MLLVCAVVASVSQQSLSLGICHPILSTEVLFTGLPKGAPPCRDFQVTLGLFFAGTPVGLGIRTDGHSPPITQGSAGEISACMYKLGSGYAQLT